MYFFVVNLAFIAAVAYGATLRFSCGEVVMERLDPLKNPGVAPSPHLHQVVGGNAFNATMSPEIDIATTSTCTTCTFTEDTSNYWTAVLYFKARNGTFKRVPQKGNVNFESASGGGTTIYYLSPSKGNVTAFRKGFRMTTGDPSFHTAAQANTTRQLTYTCLATPMTRSGETKDFPKVPCPAGIMSNIRFPTCWDGINLDSENHMSHVSYPESGTFESGGPCPKTHPVHIPQLFFETVWDTTQFNSKIDWPVDGSQPFVWSFGDTTGYGTHADYMFGWKGDALQRAMDTNCNINCATLKTQTIAEANECNVAKTVKEPIDGWLTELPGGQIVTY